MVDVTVFHGFPYADISIAGASVIATTDNDPALAKRCAEEVGAWIVGNLSRFTARITRGAEVRGSVRVCLAYEPGWSRVVINRARGDSLINENCTGLAQIARLGPTL